MEVDPYTRKEVFKDEEFVKVMTDMLLKTMYTGELLEQIINPPPFDIENSQKL